MPFPISIIFKWLTGSLGLSDAKAGPIAWVVAVLIAIAAIISAIEIYNAAVIADHETEQRADRAEKTIEQIETAEGVDTVLEESDDAAIDDMEDANDEGTRNDPSRATTAVDPSTSAIHDRMRQHRQSGSSR